MAISVWLSIGGINLARSIGIRGFHGWGNWREGGSGSRGNAAHGCDVAALAVAMETEGWPMLWGDCLIYWAPVVDRICYHRTFAIA